MACKTPCTCKNDSTFTPCTAANVCCQYCSEAPCAYAILSPCQWGIDILINPQNYVYDAEGGTFLRLITVLWRDCLFGCTYSARKYCSTGILGGERYTLSKGKVSDIQCAGMEYSVVPYVPKCYGQYIGAMEFGCAPLEMIGTADNGVGETRAAAACGWDDASAGSDQVFNLDYTSLRGGTQKVWEMEIVASGGLSGVGAYLRVNEADCISPAEPIAQFIAGDFYCMGRSTFIGTNYYHNPPHPATARLPSRLCVVPYSQNWFHQCTDAGAVCACGDKGWSTLSPPTTLVSCGGFVGLAGDGLIRSFSSTLVIGGIDITAHVTMPIGPCGYFVGAINTSCPGASTTRYFIWLLWCSGSQWKVSSYCVVLSEDGSGVPNGIVSVTAGCAGVTYPRGDACEPDSGFTTAIATLCPPVSPCCDACPCPPCDFSTAPVTLNMSVTGASSGSGTATGGGGVWCGAVTLAPSGDRMSVEVDFANCSARIGCNGLDCSTFNCIGTNTVTLTSCDPVDGTVTFTAGIFCSACGAGSYTVRFYE